MSEKCYASKDGDQFYEDPGAVIEDHLEWCDEGVVFPHDLEIEEADSYRFTLSHYVGKYGIAAIIEAAQEGAGEMAGECAEDWLSDVTDVQMADLGANLDRWASRWNLQPKFWEVRKRRSITITVLNEEGDYKFK